MLSPGGLVTLATVVVLGRVSNKIQPKYLISVGAIVAAVSMYGLTNVYGDLGFWYFANSRMLLGFGLPLLFIPITAASYDGIPKDKTDMASALINMARNTGGSIGVSIGSNVLAHREQFHQARLVESVIPSTRSIRRRCGRPRTTSLRKAACRSMRRSRRSRGLARRWGHRRRFWPTWMSSGY